MGFFRNFLDEVEGNNCCACAHEYVKHCRDFFQEAWTDINVLSFFTGADSIPPLGLGDATLTFNDTNPYPTASTCQQCTIITTCSRNSLYLPSSTMEVLVYTSVHVPCLDLQYLY